MKIPKLIHQSWKNQQVPKEWQGFQEKVQQLHPEWEYILWTDESSADYVAKEYPDFYPIYQGFSRNIMRADVFRYLIMYKMGGLYLDLDYEMIRPFDFTEAELVLPYNREKAMGDAYDGIGNAIFASVSGHPFWKAVIDDLQERPPLVKDFTQIVDATGPMLLTRIFEAGKFEGILSPSRKAFHIEVPKKYRLPEIYLKDPEIYGAHHCAGSWRERWSTAYLKLKIRKMLK